MQPSDRAPKLEVLLGWLQLYSKVEHCRVTANHINRRRPWPTTKNANRALECQGWNHAIAAMARLAQIKPLLAKRFETTKTLSGHRCLTPGPLPE
jgi:hypothetical protein